MDSCLLRWALEAKSSRMQLTEDVRSAYTAAQAQLLLARRSTHGTTSLPCTGPASTSTSSTSPLQRRSSAYGVETGGRRASLERSNSSDSTSSKSNSSSRLGSSDMKMEPGMQLFAAAEAALRTGHALTLACQETHSHSLATMQQALKQDAQQPESADDAHVLVAVLLCEEVGPMRTAVDAVRGSTQQLYITSSLPQVCACAYWPNTFMSLPAEDSASNISHHLRSPKSTQRFSTLT